MIPYVDPQDFTTMVEEERKRQIKSFRVQYGQKYKFSGKYGENLMEEVARYAMVGATIAMQYKDQFDVIHAHDWLTYLAGIAAIAVADLLAHGSNRLAEHHREEYEFPHPGTQRHMPSAPEVRHGGF